MTMPRPSLVTSSGPSPVRGFMAAMLVPLPETRLFVADCPLEGHTPPASNTLLPGHYPAWHDPMTNISTQALGGESPQNPPNPERRRFDGPLVVLWPSRGGPG